jgi:polar amino acid transport system ATP-binding protein
MSLLDLDGVGKSYGAHRVLDGITLSVEARQITCLIGASGCGKSTLLRCINGLEPIQDGEIRLEGETVSGRGVDLNALRRQVGIVFQSYNLFPHMSVLDNIVLAPRKALGLDKPEAEARALALLERVGLADKARAFPDRLSGGQQQRVAIARALAMEPKLLLLDEVTSALDPELVSEVLAIVQDLKADGITLLLATHEMGFARRSADKVVFLHQGKVHEEGSPEEIFGNPRHPRTQEFLRSIVAAGRL